ncbi:MAG: TetR/AcrR family transcriptional regulator [Deltaproteobacteria bacterium]|nr:TetR/AcrR family transcriptional regulator [Deltaproteobacteria bacterium]
MISLKTGSAKSGKERQRNNRKDEIIRIAQEIFSEKGLADTNIADIANKANVPDSIIYHYFENKQDLLFTCLAEKMKEVTNELNLHLEGIVGALPKLGKMIWFHLYINDRSPERTRLLKNLLFECRSNKNFYSHEGYNSLRAYTRILRNILREGVNEGVFCKNLNVRIVAEMIFGLLDEESLNCFASHEIVETLPDLQGITDLISAIILETADIPGEKLDKKALILESAKEIFARKGYYSATIAEIANNAGVAEGTIYTYFKNKEDLLFSIIRMHFEQLEKVFPDMFHLKHPLRKLRRFIRFTFSMFLSDRDFLKVFLLDTKLNRNFYRSSAYGDFMNYAHSIDSILDEGKKTGIFRKEIDNRLFRNLFFGSFSHVATRWLVLNEMQGIDFMQETEDIVYLLCRAVLPKEVVPGFKIGSYKVNV